MKLTDEEIYALCRRGEENNWTDEQFIHAVIDANNKKVLADLRPVASEDTWSYQNCDGYWINKGFKNSPLYSADQVAALIQRNEALEAMVKELEESMQLSEISKALI